jgi:ribosomal protein S19
VIKSNVHKKVRVYNGKKFISFYIRPIMVGHKLGEFVLTKVMGSAITLSKAEKAKSKKRG